MLKLLLSVLVSLFLVVEPVSAAGAGAGAQASSSKQKRQAVKKKPVKKKVAKATRKGKREKAVVASDKRQRMVRRVETVRGKRRVTYVLARRAAPAVLAIPAARTAGDLAGLNQTRDPLSLRSSVALVLDQNTSEVLFEKNSNVALPIASITKLMTGLVVVEAHLDLNQTLTVTDDDVDRHKYSSSRLPVGARMTRGNLLHIALMSSENRAASALGRNYPGGTGAFVAAMNAKARELGMNDTRYVDASGLSSQNVSSARDLARLVAYAHQKPLLRQYSTDPNWVVEASGRPMRYNNTNYLVALPDWNIGLQKTGFINEAGRCLVMQAMIQGRNVIMVFLDSKGKMSRTADAGRMRRWLEALTPDTVLPSAAATTAAGAASTAAHAFTTVAAPSVR
ncbi:MULTISPECIES: serine hydrolase [unclassified Massilia]|uniref:serine hydrolase n=1 Tax=unclassified Massilia TaxID=2609279 RepID=UPI00177C85FD|nr:MULTISPECIES: serine hydrolase [unclassified Massilia]MBD8528709.1 peptidase S11 [Massilia sp. CFBP 13647]MBD8672313.1 peptidase S11 [Massilia sp. CFBP 13721]